MSLESKSFFYESGSSWEEVWPGISRTIVGYDDRLMMVKVHFIEGAESPAHQHPHSQSSYVESGQFEVTVGIEKKTLKAGDAFFVHPDVMHSVRAIQAGTVVDAFSPHREDFIS